MKIIRNSARVRRKIETLRMPGIPFAVMLINSLIPIMDAVKRNR
jgi:hypothetical protein